MAEILLEPSSLSKIIPLSFDLNDTNASNVAQLMTKRQFNTADTDAWFQVTLDGFLGTAGSFDITLFNLNDKSVFNHTGKPFTTNPFYYKLDSGPDETTNEIRHAGRWVGQIVVTLTNGDSATRKFIFDIEGHILDGANVQTILLEDYNALIASIESAKDELTRYNIDYASLIGTVTDQEAARSDAEELRVIADALRETKEGIRQTTFEANEVIRDGVVDSAIEGEMIAQTVATKLAEKEATFAPRMLSLESELAEINNVVNVTKFGVTPNSAEDQTPFIQAAVDHLVSLGGGVLWFPKGEYRIIADANTTTVPYNPKRVKIAGNMTGEEIFDKLGNIVSDTRVVHYVENVHIKGDKEAVIYMTGMTEATLYNMDDPLMENVDVFCAFNFTYAKNCSISGFQIRGDYLVEGIPFRYDGVTSQARAKAVSFIGCADCKVYGMDVRYILGNFIHVNTASRAREGYWRPSEGIHVYDNYFDTCLEIGVNLTTTVTRAKVEDNVILHANGCGIEGPGLIRGNTIKHCKGGGISPSGDAIVSANDINDVRDALILTGPSRLTHGQHINTTIVDNLIRNIRRKFLYVYAGSGNAIVKNNKFINSNLEDDKTSTIEHMVYFPGNLDKPVSNVNLSDNHFEINNVASFVQYGVFAVYLKDSYIANNKFSSLKDYAADIYLSNCVGNTIKDNKLTKQISVSSTNSDRNSILDNDFSTSNYPITVDWIQGVPPSSGSWRIGDIIKRPATVTPKGAMRNIELGWSCVSITPLIWEPIYANAVRYENNFPASGTWTRGEKAYMSAPLPGNPVGWVCGVSGTFGTLSGVTATTTAGSSSIVVNTTTGLLVGNYIKIAGVSGVKKVIGISGTSVTLDTSADVAVIGATVAYQVPSLYPFGTTDLQASLTWDPPSLASGTGVTSGNISLSYAVLGDFVLVSAPYDLQGITATAHMSSAGIAKIRLDNFTGGTIDLASGTWKIKVIKA